jgi:hypothetical protein
MLTMFPNIFWFIHPNLDYKLNGTHPMPMKSIPQILVSPLLGWRCLSIYYALFGIRILLKYLGLSKILFNGFQKALSYSNVDQELSKNLFFLK